ncbi:MAG: recG [Candidatus Kaiserbacteria bacterium]|nr:recG [Candidatus Kaiserbacteria bacterium]
MQPQDLLQKHFRLTPLQLRALNKLKLKTIGDVLEHFPVRYESSGSQSDTRSLVVGDKVTLTGSFSKIQAKKLWKSRRAISEGTFEDGQGRVRVMWFNQPYIASYVKVGTPVRMSGVVGGSADKPYIANPAVEPVTAEEAIQDTGMFVPDGTDTTNTLYAVYPESQGVTSLWFRHTIAKILAARVHEHTRDPLPQTLLNQYHLPGRSVALVWIHTPEKNSDAQAARKRFAFEEMFVLQVSRAQERARNASMQTYTLVEPEKYVEKFLSSLPFPPTGAQKRAIDEVIHDMERPYPMARLLEGDVGSGKTIVAAASSYAVVHSQPPGRKSGTLQVAYMAPTEILAQQHFESFITYFKDLPLNIGIITGSGCKKFPSKSNREAATPISRTQFLKWVAGGEIAVVIGTHALIQKSVEFQNLALTIVDEQHRFGTAQRHALSKKGTIAPHFLSMTATPIPRTLALTVYGDLDLSLLDELPPGRAKIITQIVTDDTRNEAYERMRSELDIGHQVYVICPRIEEPDPEKLNALQAKSAKAEAKRLQADVFPDVEVGLLHGAMTPKEKEAALREFTENKIQILVATSVVEVGINVPNATVILIEGASRFGLAQLHQLRGRIMRSSDVPYCFLLADSKSEVSVKRLRALAKSSDGFELAEADLKARGAGDLYGDKQWGISDIGMEALQNMKLIQAARTEAEKIVEKDFELSHYPELRAQVQLISTNLHHE